MYSSSLSFSKRLHCQYSLCSLILGVTSAITLIGLYHPHPFKFTLVQVQQLMDHQTNVPIKPHHTDEKCDLFKGKWIPDQNGSSYKSTNCRTIPEWYNCFKHGRKDQGFVNWRWKPHQCELPRFDPKVFLKIVEGKTMAFIGDSLARNQMESLLCLLAQEEALTLVNGKKERGDRTFFLPSYNFTLMWIGTTFLVFSEEIVINGLPSSTYNIHLDKIDENWAKRLPGIDYAILSDAQWFFRKNYLYENGRLIGCTQCNSSKESNITNLGLGFVIGKAFQTALSFINGCNNCRGLLTLLRTFTPAHFENGAWNTGGYCNRTNPLGEGGGVNLEEGFEWELRTVQMKEIERYRKQGGHEREQKFGVLDVTGAMLVRADGHPGFHWGDKWIKGVNDCLHWCLPGPIDAWNDMLLQVLRKETVLTS